VTWTFTDVNGNASTQTQNVVIDDVTPPVPNFEELLVISDECLVGGITPPTATDNCGEVVTGVASTTFPITDQDTTVVTWTFTDVNGNVSSQTQTVVIADTSAPVPDIATLPVVSDECVVGSLPVPTATDNCGEVVTGVTSTTFPIKAQGTTIVTWTFTDVNGNVASQNQTVEIADTTAPTPDVASLEVVSDECEVIGITPPTATDNCGEVVTGVTSTTFPIKAQGTTIVTWTFTDVNGNVASQNQTVEIADTTAPTPDVASLEVVSDECEVIGITPPTATDNCGEVVTGVTSTTFPIKAQGTTIVTWTFTDVNGNVASQNQTVEIADTTAPTPDVASLEVVSDECEVTGIIPPTATDNCGEIVTGVTSTSFPITTQGTTVVTWTFADVNGNVSSQNQAVVIMDTTAALPIISTLPDVVDGCIVESVIAPKAVDNCGDTIAGTTNTVFPITTPGTTIVTWTYTDAQGKQSNQTQNVVIDPSISYGIVVTRVWSDLNGDGLQNIEEDTANLEGIMVHLLDDGNGTILQSQLTDSSGMISFRDVPVGMNLRLEYELPNAYSYTESSGKIEAVNNSDVNTKGGNIGMTDRFSFEIACDTITYIDAGLLTPGIIEARVWNDLNGDQTQNASEDNANISGVTVQLLDADDKNALLATVVSDNNGLAVFPAVPIARKLSLKFIQPAGYEFTKKSGKIEDIDNSDASDKGKKAGETSTFELENSGELITYVDAGLQVVLDLTDTDIRKIAVRDIENNGVDQVTIAVYPNPASRLINITSNKEEIKNAMIFDSQGKLVLHSKDVNQFLNQLDISELKNGQYYILVKTESGRFIQQFIKM
jgi:hypothetical protein